MKKADVEDGNAARHQLANNNPDCAAWQLV